MGVTTMHVLLVWQRCQTCLSQHLGICCHKAEACNNTAVWTALKGAGVEVAHGAGALRQKLNCHSLFCLHASCVYLLLACML